ncbi:hypothetical protein COCNU_04G014600 [Cocos nucifera]|uniref:Uncharacterized protein n=1 Tax=Cocos nucifera TaxID=13894 RepID=A0A8K0N1D5_COCNU|nr:hypothetical protein COCNU_04G014600 [Cocos nucifera]
MEMQNDQGRKKAKGNPNQRRGQIKEQIYSDVRKTMSDIVTTVMRGKDKRGEGEGGAGCSTSTTPRG